MQQKTADGISTNLCKLERKTIRASYRLLTVHSTILTSAYITDVFENVILRFGSLATSLVLLVLKQSMN